MLLSPRNTTASPSCQLSPRVDWKLRNALEGTMGNQKWSKRLRSHQRLAQTRKKGAVLRLMQALAWVPDQLDLEVASLSAHARYPALSFNTWMIFGARIMTWQESNAQGHGQTQSHVYRLRFLLLKNPCCSCLNQRGNPILKFVRSVPWEFGEVVPDYVLGQTTCALFLRWVLTFLPTWSLLSDHYLITDSRCFVSSGLAEKSAISQPQSKLHPRPPQAPRAEFHLASLTSTSRCGKQKVCLSLNCF